MRWDALFDDLEAQTVALERRDRGAEAADRARVEAGSVRLVDRLAADIGAPVRIRSAGGFGFVGRVLRVGPDWVLIADGAGGETVLALSAALRVGGLARYAVVADAGSTVSARLGLRHMLRGMVRDRSSVRIALLDGSVLAGTIDRVGADFVEVAVHPVGEQRRRRDVLEIMLVSIGAVVAVTRDMPSPDALR